MIEGAFLDFWISDPRLHAVLQPLSSGISPGYYRPEVEVFEGKVCLDDACGLHSGPQDVLLCGLVVRRTDPI